MLKSLSVIVFLTAIPAQAANSKSVCANVNTTGAKNVTLACEKLSDLTENPMVGWLAFLAVTLFSTF